MMQALKRRRSNACHVSKELAMGIFCATTEQVLLILRTVMEFASWLTKTANLC